REFLAAGSAARKRGNGRRPAFVAWSRSERCHELARATGCDYPTVFFSGLVRPGLVPVRYLLSAIATASFLLRMRPTAVVATNPPIFPGLIASLYCRATGSRLLLDSHPRGFGHK